MNVHTRKLFVATLAMALASTLVVIVVRGAGVNWDPARAANYLDSRQQAWFAWRQAQSADGPCVSCHTGMPYLLARPALRSLLKEKAPTMYEIGLRSRLASHAGEKPKGALQSVETIMAAMFVTDAEPRRKTFDQLWTLQQSDGALKGGWQWYNANLDPWETPAQFRYGAALAALAIGAAPPEIRDTPDAQQRIRALADFLLDGLSTRPLHVRIAALWASTTVPSLLDADARGAIVADVLRAQQPDGGWTLASLGPWNEHASAPAPIEGGGSNSYATAFTTYVLQQTGDRNVKAATSRALDWLRTHQDPRTGAWPAVSMNKIYPAGSMEEKFMQDAATAYAAAALAGH
jgi:squalene-hopene/tetraprenyl-beta-curcumene cyclase